MDITKMKVSDLINYLLRAKDEELISIVKSGQLCSLSDELFKIFFLKNNHFFCGIKKRKIMLNL